MQKLTVPEGLVQPGLALKYSCLKNMGHIQELLDDKTGALEFYLKVNIRAIYDCIQVIVNKSTIVMSYKCI